MGADGAGLLLWKSPHKWNCMQTKTHPELPQNTKLLKWKASVLKTLLKKKNLLVVVQSKHSVVVAEGELLNQTLMMEVKHLEDYETNLCQLNH